MKKNRLENVTKEDKNELVKALDKLASKKQSKSKESSGHLRSKKRSSKKNKVRRRRIKDGDFEYKMEEGKSSSQTQILIVLKNKS